MVLRHICAMVLHRMGSSIGNPATSILAPSSDKFVSCTQIFIDWYQLVQFSMHDLRTFHTDFEPGCQT